MAAGDRARCGSGWHGTSPHYTTAGRQRGKQHFHTLVTCGGFTADGEFLELPELDMERLHAAWREAVFALYLAEGKIEPEVVENMRSWAHSGFHVDQSVHLAADAGTVAQRWSAGVERLMQYMTRCPFSLSRPGVPGAPVKVTKTGEVVYKAEKDACRAFPDPQRELLESGTDDDGNGQTAFFDGAEELTFVPDPDWERQPPSCDVPWEVTSDAYGDPFDARF